MNHASVIGSALAAGDPSSSRTVYAVVVALAIIGVVLVVITVWIARQTRVDLPVLAPLETMSDRRWRRLDPASQRRMLDEARPPGAEPLLPAPSAPLPDQDFATAMSRPVTGFEDLADPEVRAPEEATADAGGLAARSDPGVSPVPTNGASLDPAEGEHGADGDGVTDRDDHAVAGGDADSVAGDANSVAGDADSVAGDAGFVVGDADSVADPTPTAMAGERSPDEAGEGVTAHVGERASADG